MLDLFVGRERERITLRPGQSATAELRQVHTFANDRDEAATITMETKPAGGVVKAFQLAYGIANHGGAANDGLPKSALARLLFIKTSQGYLPAIPRFLQQMVFAFAGWVARITGLHRKFQAYLA